MPGLFHGTRTRRVTGVRVHRLEASDHGEIVLNPLLQVDGDAVLAPAVAKPLGTRMPSVDNAAYICPKDAFLPPTRPTSSSRISENQRI